jgi:hypothetical protein
MTSLHLIQLSDCSHPIIEEGVVYVLVNLEHNHPISYRSMTPNQAADHNYELRLTNQRWIPEPRSIDPWDM